MPSQQQTQFIERTISVGSDGMVDQVPQRPYVTLDALMAQIVDRHPSVERMRASLAANAPEPAGMPVGAPSPNDVVDEDGVLVRYIVAATPPERFIRDGAVRETVNYVSRRVALSQEQARLESDRGNPTDFWNGFTWLRDGYKPERDFAVVAAQNAGTAQRRFSYERDVDATDIAQMQRDFKRIEAVSDPLPVVPAATAPPARKER